MQNISKSLKLTSPSTNNASELVSTCRVRSLDNRMKILVALQLSLFYH